MIMADQKYVRLCKSLYDKGTLIKKEDLYKNISSDKEYYISTYYYDQKHYNDFQKTKSVKGIRDVKTNILWWDFDNESDPELSRKDAIELTKRLKDLDVNEKDIEVYFSGNKGYNVVITLDKELTPEKVGKICLNIGKNLPTLDTSLYDAVQILRVPGTRHKKSGLFKIPLTVKQLKNTSTVDIKKLASSLDNIQEDFQWSATKIDESKINFEEPKQQEKVATSMKLTDILSKKPRDWKDYKWALLNAYMVKPDERHESLMRIAATCRGLGYPEEMAKLFCLTFDEKFCAETKKEPVRDLETNILPSVYSEHWNGGQYSFKNDIFLQKYVQRIGLKPEDTILQETTIPIEDAFTLFKDYATNIDKITIKTGIRKLDQKLRMTIGMSVGIVAPPGVGKSTLSLQILNAMSKLEEKCIFFSYDMYHALIFQKLAQKHLGVTGEELFEKFKAQDQDFEDKVINVLKKEYKNVEFCFNTGQTPTDISATIKRVEEESGEKVRLIIVDYNELVMSDFSDATQSSSYVAQKLNEIAKMNNVCVITLVQPNKMAGSPSDELKSYRNMKGSSALEQSFSVILGMWRPGYDDRYPEDDKFITINCLKNRMGSMFRLDLGWDGEFGRIYELSDEQEEHLQRVRDRKKAEENDEDAGWK